MADETPDILLPIEAVLPRSGYKHRATIYRQVAAGTFPEPVQIGPRRVAWRERDILAWQRTLPVGVKSIA